MISPEFIGFLSKPRGMVRRCCACVVGATLASTLLFGCAGKQARFATPDAAAQALVDAVRANDEARLREILGRDSEEIISSGDDVADENARAGFIESYEEKNGLEEVENGGFALRVGANDWTLPIPIVQRGNEWQFDCRRGKEEILNRRIGANELYAIEVCRAIVDAQKEYLAADPDGDGVSEYAARFVSEPGTKNGLYWETSDGESPSPLGLLAAAASEEGYALRTDQSAEPGAYHGYHYRMLLAQGPSAAGGARSFLENGNMTRGFAVVAWPAEYGNSGVVTFIVSHYGLVFEQDLGSRTDRIAREIKEFDPDSDWRLAE